MLTASGHKVEVLQGKELDGQLKDFKGYQKGLVRLNPGRWLILKGFTKFADKIYNFAFRPRDVLLMTYPKCGTTWTQEILWTMMNNPNLDNPQASLTVMTRSPFQEGDIFIEASSPDDPSKYPFLDDFKKMCPGKNPEDGIMMQMSEFVPDPRIIKTHLPLSLFSPSLLDTCKVIYVARNPKDVVVSYYHHSNILKPHGYNGTLEDFVEYFVNDNLVYGPYWLHLKEAWLMRHHPNFLFIFYEDMKADIIAELKKMDAFLGTDLNQDQLNNVAKHTSFKEMRKKGSSFIGFNEEEHFNTEKLKKDGGFFRKGEVGDWKRKLTPEMSAKIDEWIEKYLNKMDMEFKYSI